MALELQALTFVVNTDQLDEARIKIAKLGDAVAALNKPLQDMSRSSAKTNEVIAKSELAAEKARIATKALGEQVEDSGEQMSRTEAYINKLVTGLKIFRGETITVQDSALKLGDSFTKGQANAIAYQMQIGATTEQLKLIAKQFQDINAFSNTNPFDKSTRGLSTLRQEIAELQMVDKFMRDGVALTREQIVNLAKDSERLTQAYNSMGKSQQELTAELVRLKTETIDAAKQKNILTEAARQSEIQAKKEADALIEQSRAIKLVNDAMMKEWAASKDTKDPVLVDMAAFYRQQGAEADQLAAKVSKLNDIEQKLAFTNQELATGMTTASANALYDYRRRLEDVGTSSEVVAKKMQAFKEQLMIKQQHSPIAGIAKDAKAAREQVDHLSRAIGVQLGDVAVSLAGGMNPFLVLIQQGDQLRFAVQAAREAGQDLEGSMKKALSGIVMSFIDTGKVIGGFFVNSMLQAGQAVTDLAVKILFANKTIQAHSLATAISADSGNKLASFLVGAFSRIPMLIGAAAGSVTIFAGIALAAFFSVEKQMKSLTTSLILTGGSLGLTTDSAIRMAQSMEQVGVSSSKAMTVMTAMAKQGGFASREIELVTKSAVDMQKWLGVSVEDTVKQFSKLKGEPVEALIEIAKQTGLVDSATLATVISLAEQGRTAEAAAIAMKSYGDVTVAQVQRAKQEYTEFAQLMIGIGEGLGKFWDNVKSLWIKAAPGVQLTDQIDKINMRLRGGFLSEDHRKQLEDQRKVLTDQYMILEKKRLNEEQSLVLNTKSAKVMESAFKTTSQYLTGINKLEFERTAAINQQEKIKSQFQRSEISQEAYVAGMIASSVKLAKIDKDIEEQKNKGKTKPSFSPDSDNTISDLKKRYEEQLRVISDGEKTKQSELKGQYDAELIGLGEFQAKELALMKEAESEKLRVVDSFEKQYKDAVSSREQALKSEAILAIKQGADSVEVNKELQTSLNNLGREADTTYEHFKNLRSSIENAADRRLVQSFNESAKAIRANNKELENLRTTLKVDYLLSVKAVDIEQATSAMNELDAIAYKVRLNSLDTTKKMQHYVTLQNQALEATKAYEDFVNNSVINSETIARANQLAAVAKTAKDNLADADRLATEYAEKQSEIAVKQKYLEKFKEIQKELGDVMFLALTNRGAQAGKKLRDLIKAELMKPITLVVNAVVNTLLGQVSGAPGLSSGGASGALSLASNLSGLAGIGSAFGTAFGASAMSTLGLGGSSAAMTTSLANAGYWSGSAAATSASSLGASIGAYAPYALAAVVALDQLGILDRWSGDPDAFLVQRSHASQNKSSYDMSRSTAFGEIGFVDGTGYINKGNGVISEYGETEDVSREFRQTVLDIFSTLDAEIARTLTAGQIAKVSKELEGWYKKSWSFEGNMIDDWIASRYEKVLQTLDPSFTNLKDYQKEGEKLTDTAVRMITAVSVTKATFESLGISTDNVTTTFVNDVSEMLGGISNFSSAMQYFYENFFSEDEQIANQTEKLTKEFDALGKTLPKTKDEFKALLEGALGSGDKSLAASLIKLMPAFNDFISVTEEASTAFKELTDSLLEEINRLRGAILGDAGVSGNVSGLSAEFAILTAQARAGSVTAIEKLPEYSQAIEQAVAASAVNASDVAYARAWLAESLGNTSSILNGTDPSLVSSSASFTQDVSTPAVVNGAAVITASTSSQSDLIAALIAEVQGLRAEVRADVSANSKTAKILERANQDGETLSVSVV